MLGAPQIGLAQNSGPAPVSIEAQDEALVREALSALARRGYDGLRPYMTQLSDVVARAPASYPRVEERDGVTIVRVMDANPASLAGDVAIQARGRGKTLNYRVVFNVYGAAYFMRGGYAVQSRLPEAAIVELDRGLALPPDNPDIIAEKGSALNLLRRWPEMLALYDAALAQNPPFISNDEKARLMRGKALALTQLGQLDESERIYNQSLAIQPGNQAALDGLTNIARLRGGGPQTAPGLIIPGQPGRGGRGQPPAATPLPARPAAPV